MTALDTWMGMLDEATTRATRLTAEACKAEVVAKELHEAASDACREQSACILAIRHLGYDESTGKKIEK